MWDAIKNVGSILGLVGISLGLAYLLANQIVAKELIDSSFAALFLFCFFGSLVIVGLIFAVLGISIRPNFDAKQKAVGSENEQNIDSTKLKERDSSASQTAWGKKNKQNIK